MLDQHIVETPESISFGYPVAGIGSRFLAIVVDTIIQWVMFLLVLVVLLLASTVANSFENPIVRALPNYLAAILLIVLFLIQFGYFILVEILTGGQSPGKSLFGLRVVKENGYPLTPVDSIIRNLLRIVDFMPFAYVVGLVTMLLNDQAKRLGDFAVGTLVVRVSAPAKLEKAAVTPPPAAIELPGVERLSEEEIELAESFLQRRRELQNADALGHAIAEHLTTRLDAAGSAYATPHTPDDFLALVVAAYRRRGEKVEAPR